jgi:hypothetical protein
MKIKLFTLFALVALLVSSVAPAAALAQAYSTSFTTSITYQNVGTGAAKITILFYATPDSVTPIEVVRPDLPKDAGTSLFIGSLTTIGSGFRGSAVMQSDQPLLATLVQIPQGSATVRNRPLSNGFSGGASVALIATVLKNEFDTNTIFSVQNVDNADNTISIKFYNTSATLVHTINTSVKPGAAYYVDAGRVNELGASFNGSAVVEAKRADNSNGAIIASAMELSISATGASAFEGVGAGSKTFYMPSALCQAFGANTSYAIQNTSLTTQTNVTVTYSNGATQTQTIPPGAKRSYVACNATGMPTGFNGAATVTSSATDVIAIGKAYGSGLSTAFVGASQGAAKVALPYVRWASNANFAAGVQQRTNITIQNIGGSALPANSVTVQYVDKNGTVVGTHTINVQIAQGAKVNSNATMAGLSEFGVYPDGSFGGGAIVTGPGGAQLAVVARVSTQIAANLYASEDYNGMPVP